MAAGCKYIRGELGIGMDKLTEQRKDLLILAIICIERLGGKVSITDQEEVMIDNMELTVIRDYANKSTVFTVTKLQDMAV